MINDCMDWTSSDLINVSTWTEINCVCNMLDKLADLSRQGFVSTFENEKKSLKNWQVSLTQFLK